LYHCSMFMFMFETDAREALSIHSIGCLSPSLSVHA
jgi:hypothetical protein